MATQQQQESVTAPPRYSRSGTGKGIIAFLLISFGFAWAVWLPLWLLGVPATSEVAQQLQIVGAFAPALAAIVVRRWVTREGFGDAGLRPNVRKNWPYYVFSLLWPFLIVIGLVACMEVIGAVRGDLALTRPGLGALADVSAWLSMVAAALIYTPLIWGEEFGWRGYLQIRLLAQRPLQAAVVTGLIWGIWHFPAALAGLIPNGHGILSMLLLPWYMVWISIVLGWLRLRTGSIWPASIAHSANNFILNSSQVGVVLSFSGGLGDLLLSPRGLIIVIPIGLLCAWIVLSGGLKPTPHAWRRATSGRPSVHPGDQVQSDFLPRTGVGPRDSLSL